jgi:hypothetical protein
MMDAPETINPYEAPKAPLVDDRPTTRRFRWQVIPAAFCGFLSALVFLAIVRLHSPFSPELYARFVLSGLLWLASAVLWLRSRWWIAVSVATLSYYVLPLIHS